MLGIVAIIVVVVVLWAGVIGVGLCGNFWYTEDSVSRELKIEYPNVTEVIKTVRNIYKYSKIYVKENGKPKVYLLDTSVLWNYEFHPEE